MAYGKNTEAKEIRPGAMIPDVKNYTNSTISYNQGDHLIFDATNNVVRAPTAEAEMSTYLGIAQLDVVSGFPRSPYSTLVTASQGVTSMLGPIFGNQYTCTLHTGVNLNPGQALYADIATASDGVSPSGTKQIGLYDGPAITSSAAGLRVVVTIGHRWPNDTLGF